MRSTFALAAALLSAAALAQAPAPSPEDVRAHMAFLADDLLEGRHTGTRGYDIAARYVASQFALAGLRPAGDAGPDGARSWFQRVPLRRLEATGGELRLRASGAERAFANAADLIVQPAFDRASEAVTAPLVFAGFGLSEPSLKLDDYRGLDVRGKIVVVLGGFPKGMNSEAGAHLAAGKGRAAAARGAIGILTVDTLEGRQVRPWARVIRSATEPWFTWLAPDGTPWRAAPGIRLSARVSPTAAAALFEGAPRTLDAVLAEADRPGGAPHGFALPGRATLSAQGRWQDIASANVAGILPGTDPAAGQEVVVLTAHLDHLGLESGRSGDNLYNGALDNAAGIATMLEAAKGFAGQPQKRSILFLAVTAEEEGLLGARYFANNPSVPGPLVANVNLDMPLLLYPFTDVVAFGADRSSIGPAIAEAVRGAGVTLSPDPMPEQGIFTRSDHYAFVERGVPSVMLATGYANGGQKAWTDFFRDRYHQPGDDLSQPIDYAAAARFADINRRIAAALANAPERPRWNPGDLFGRTPPVDAHVKGN